MTVAVGVDDPTLLGEHLAGDSERIDDLEAENERLRERNETLEARLATVEAELGLGDGAGTAPADD